MGDDVLADVLTTLAGMREKMEDAEARHLAERVEHDQQISRLTYRLEKSSGAEQRGMPDLFSTSATFSRGEDGARSASADARIGDPSREVIREVGGPPKAATKSAPPRVGWEATEEKQS